MNEERMRTTRVARGTKDFCRMNVAKNTQFDWKSRVLPGRRQNSLLFKIRTEVPSILYVPGPQFLFKLFKM